MKHHVSTFLLLLLLTYSNPASSQTKWFKYEGNPVLDVGPQGGWEDAAALIDRVIIQDSVYQMWYNGRSRENPGAIGFATSRDGLTWEKSGLNPVLRVGPQWESSGLHRPYVVWTGSSYRMWYNNADAVTVSVGYASSPDGIVWTKYPGNPVLQKGPSGSWDSKNVGWVSVVGPDISGRYKLWYEGLPGFKIGYATATDETSWTKSADPVFEDYAIVYYPRVIYNGDLYEMWYCVELQPALIGYATSVDGVHWTKSPENPVLRPGPPGAWDEKGLHAGDILFDGKMYRMWYHGAANEYRSGYAVSPKGMSITVLPSFVSSNEEESMVQVAVKVTDATGLSFSARIMVQAENVVSKETFSSLRQVAFIDLFDDGAHNDSLANDGLFANSWVPPEKEVYFVDLKMKLKEKKTLEFEMVNAGAFTTIGPVKLKKVEVVGDDKPQPGDTILVKLTLRNHDTMATARAIATTLTTTDPSVNIVPGPYLTYGDILPGDAASTSGYHRLVVNPDFPRGKDVRLEISITRLGVYLWHDSFQLRIFPPWWRTNWAYGLYLLLIVGSVAGMIRYVEIRKLKRRIQRLEQEHALERERARISQDMHDEVGATLTEIAILSELSKKKPEEADKHIQRISERAAEVIDNIGEIVWALNPKNDSLDNVIAHIRRHAVEYLKPTPVKFRFVIPDQLPTYPLSGEIRRNLFLTAKEAIHNIVKHSQASEVTISMKVEKYRLELFIEDNGVGFSIDERQGSGNGLQNMKKRIEEIGGTFNLDSHPNQGTKARIVLDLKAHN